MATVFPPVNEDGQYSKPSSLGEASPTTDSETPTTPVPALESENIDNSYQHLDGSASELAHATAELTDTEYPDTDDFEDAPPEDDSLSGIWEDNIEAVTRQCDLGEVPIPILRSLTNEQLWLLIRRFNKRVSHVKAIKPSNPLLGGLDLNVAEEEQFSPDKLRGNYERLYMTVILGMVAFAKHVARLRSWNERRRSAAYCSTYFIAWYYNLILPLILSTMILLIVYPPSRPFLFPPAPLAVVSAISGKLQAPKAGELGTADTLTGAPEEHQGEAVEAEASNFVSGIIALTSQPGEGVGEGDRADGNDGVEESLLDATSPIGQMNDARRNVDSDPPARAKDKTKVPMQAAIRAKAQPAMRAVGDIVDTWERFANMLSPTPPFHPYRARLQFAYILVALVLVTTFTPAAVIVKMLGFVEGFLFFGQPIMNYAYYELNTRYPNWKKDLDIRNGLHYGVPTNAQLALTLLRIGEKNGWPLPPPPHLDVPSASTSQSSLIENLPEGLGERTAGAQVDRPSETERYDASASDLSLERGAQPKTNKSKFVSALKGTARAGVAAALGPNRIKAIASFDIAKQRFGAALSRNMNMPMLNTVTRPEDGPEYKARLNGKQGKVYITLDAPIPSVSFRIHGMRQMLGGTGAAMRAVVTGEDGTNNSPQLESQLSIALSDIRELKKIDGMGWKSKLVVGYALKMETADGLEVTYRDRAMRETQTVRFLAMGRRDELFNRLIALGGRKWECW